MLIALDYDRTFTEDPDFWREVIRIGRARGHRFVCVTARQNPPDFTREPEIPCKVVCSQLGPKEPAARAAGYSVDVWVDDCPQYIKADGFLTWDYPP